MQQPKQLLNQFVAQLTEIGALIERESQVLLYTNDIAPSELKSLNTALENLFEIYAFTKKSLNSFEIVFTKVDTAETEKETSFYLCLLIQTCYELRGLIARLNGYQTLLNSDEEYTKQIQAFKKDCLEQVHRGGQYLNDIRSSVDDIHIWFQGNWPHPHGTPK